MHGELSQTNICNCHTYLIESIAEIGIILWLILQRYVVYHDGCFNVKQFSACTSDKSCILSRKSYFMSSYKILVQKLNSSCELLLLIKEIVCAVAQYIEFCDFLNYFHSKLSEQLMMCLVVSYSCQIWTVLSDYSPHVLDHSCAATNKFSCYKYSILGSI